MPPLRLTSLKALCQAQGTPFHELCFDDAYGGVVQRGISESFLAKVPTAYVCCGAARDVNIFSGTYVHTPADEYVFHGQSSQNSPKRAGFKSIVEAYIESHRETLFQSYVEEECVYFGGMWGIFEEPARNAHIVPASNFGHFIFEYLTRMAIFEVLGLTQRLPLVVCDELPDPWIDFIVLAGGSRDRLIRVPAARAQAYRHVWIASSCSYRDAGQHIRFWNAGLHWLRFRVLQSIGGPRISERRRIYIGREGALTRRIVNEPEVITTLARYGIQPVIMSELTPREQVEIVSGAELIVASLGAGNVISYFAPEHCANIILAPRDIGTGLWGGAGAALFSRQPYERLECEPVAGGSASRLNLYGRDELTDFRVDLKELCKLVEAAIKLTEVTQMRDVMKV